MDPPPACGLGVRKGAWSKEEDLLLQGCVEKYGAENWHLVPSRTGLRRCRKSCRLRWLNYIDPAIKRGHFSGDEVDLMIRMHKLLGNRWSLIAGRLPGRTANDVKNFWNSHLSKKETSTRPAKNDQTAYRSSVVPIKPKARRFTSITPHLCTFSPPHVSSSKPPGTSMASPAAKASSTASHNFTLPVASQDQLSGNQLEDSWLQEMMNLDSVGEHNIVPDIDETDFDLGDLLVDSQLWAPFDNGSSWLT